MPLTTFREAWMIAALWLLGVVVLTAAERPGSDWPQFQGPLGNGSSPETGLLREWPQDGPRVLWRAKIKPGWSCPAVVGDDVYLCWTEELRGERETAACLKATTGEIRWQHTYDVDQYWKRNIGWARGGVRATPAVHGDWLFTLGAVGHLHCLDRHSGQVLWQQNLWDEWNPSGEKGYVFSPIVVEGRLILWYSDGVSPAQEPLPDPETGFAKRLVLCRALDPATGKLLWESRQQHRPTARCGEGQTPAVAMFGRDHCLVVTANCELKALRIADGREVWKLDCIRHDGRGTTIPTPLVLDRYIVDIPDLDWAHVVEVDRARPDAEAKILWKKDLNMFTAIHQFRHRDGLLYGFAGEILGESEKSASESKLNLVCIELGTGQVMWSQPGFQNGIALTEADGLLFVRSYQTLRLVAATPGGYRETGKVLTHNVWKPTLNLLDMVQPVLSRGRLYIRTPEELICYQVAAE